MARIIYCCIEIAIQTDLNTKEIVHIFSKTVTNLQLCCVSNQNIIGLMLIVYTFKVFPKHEVTLTGEANKVKYSTISYAETKLSDLQCESCDLLSKKNVILHPRLTNIFTLKYKDQAQGEAQR